jgi:hypothetical protein
LSRLRVTERRAWRLGTTHPIHSPGDESSTGWGHTGAGPVDNSAGAGPCTGLETAIAPLGT